MISTIIVALAFAGILLWVTARHRYMLQMLLLILFGIVVRFASVVYLDLFGPAYSQQLLRDLGPGSAALPMFLAYAAFFSAFLVVFREKNVRELVGMADDMSSGAATGNDALVAHMAFAACATFLVLLFADFIRIGVVPLSDGLERYEYTQLYGGVWHGALMEYGVLLALIPGLFYTHSLLRQRPDNRFIFVILLTLGYLFLAGHRFSAFYTYSLAFLIPVSMVTLWQHRGAGPSQESRRVMQVWSKLIQFGALTLAFVLVGMAVYNSYYVVRDTGQRDPKEILIHRVLVQPGELWYASWYRVFVQRANDPTEVYDRLFVHTIVDPGRNSTIPYLMFAEIGARAYPMLDAGGAYAGGFPEVFFELFGPVTAWPVLIVTGWIIATLYLVFMRAILQRRYVRSALCWYVLYAFAVLVFGGMLNFLVNWKFWLKAGTLVAWIVFERERDRQHADSPATAPA